MDTAIDAYGRLDILVNVVGVGGAVGTAVEVDMAEWAKGMEINVGSMVSLQCHGGSSRRMLLIETRS